jgi:hypothetical protein
MPTTAHIQFLHDFRQCKIEYMVLLGWLGVTKSHTNCNAKNSPHSIYMISEHVKSNAWYFKGDATPTAMPTTVNHQFYANCNANHSPYSILHDFGPCKIKYMVLLGWLGVTKSHTKCSANYIPNSHTNCNSKIKYNSHTNYIADNHANFITNSHTNCIANSHANSHTSNARRVF